MSRKRLLPYWQNVAQRPRENQHGCALHADAAKALASCWIILPARSRRASATAATHPVHARGTAICASTSSNLAPDKRSILASAFGGTWLVEICSQFSPQRRSTLKKRITSR